MTAKELLIKLIILTTRSENLDFEDTEYNDFVDEVSSEDVISVAENFGYKRLAKKLKKYVDLVENSCIDEDNYEKVWKLEEEFEEMCKE